MKKLPWNERVTLMQVNPTMIYLCEKMKKNIFKEQHEEDEEFC